jgi:hypothetical protein
MKARELAIARANEQLKNFNAPAEDVPFLRAVITECYLFPGTLPSLKFGFNHQDDQYTITVRGYEDLLDMVAWCNKFKAKNRDKMLSHVRNLYVQQTPNGPCNYVIEMDGVKFYKQTQTPASAAAVSSDEDNDDDDDEDDLKTFHKKQAYHNKKRA